MVQFRRVTMQDIANACGLSRNTVSKVFNEHAGVPAATRELVLAKAQELGYVQGNEAGAPEAHTSRNIALFTHSKPRNHNFGSLFITNFTDQICRENCNLKVFEIDEADYRRQALPPHFVASDVAGIVAIELFDRDYIRMLCQLNFPLILVDSYSLALEDLMSCDELYMENFASTVALTRKMIGNGARRIGFVGDRDHCASFRQRWDGYFYAVTTAGLSADTELCILADDANPYGEIEWMMAQLDAMPVLPDAFVCANDFIAIRVMQALRRRGVRIPEDVMVTGFDGTPEAEVVTPTLTSAGIPAAEMGRIAADSLLERIACPDKPYQRIHVQTTPIWRESTDR